MLRKIKYGFLIAAVFIISEILKQIFPGLLKQAGLIRYPIIILLMSVILFFAFKEFKQKKYLHLLREEIQIGLYAAVLSSLYSCCTFVYQYIIMKEQFLINLRKYLIDSGVQKNQTENIIRSFNSAEAVLISTEGASLTSVSLIGISGLLAFIALWIRWKFYKSKYEYERGL